MTGDPQPQPLLTRSEVAAVFNVSRRTVAYWTKLGRLPYLRTPGGQYRYPEAEIRQRAELRQTRRQWWSPTATY